jgi:two-component system cell cycle response regulator
MQQPKTRVLALATTPPAEIAAEVELAEDLDAALDRLAGGGVQVLLVRFDGDPRELRAIRDRAPDLPIVAVAPPDLSAAALEAGAHDHVPPDAGAPSVERAIRYATSLHLLRAELHRRQTVDELTGLFNPRGFEQLAEHHLRLADRTQRPLVLLFLRLNDVEEAAQPPGAAGPKLVAETADVLRQVVRGSDVLARVGIDRFCVLLTGDAAGMESRVLSRLVGAIEARDATDGRRVPLSISVGSATYDPAHPVGLAELISEADRRMQDVPEGGMLW